MKGKFKRRTGCRFCDSKKLAKILDFGYMPHAGDYLTALNVGKELYYPLRIYICKKCGLVQNMDIIASEILFKEYHYLSSVSLSDHFKDFADEIYNKFLKKKSFIVEIGSNDGVLLSPLKKMGAKVLGVDPAMNIAKVAKKKGIKTIVDFFDDKVALSIVKKYGKADVVLANNVLAHIDEIKKVFKGIKKLLKAQGIFIFEVHYLPDLIAKMQYDFFYSEHLSYYSLGTLIPFLRKFDLEIFDVKKIPIHSGSIRIYAKSKNNRQRIGKKIERFLEDEKKLGISEMSLKQFSAKIYKHRNSFRKLLLKLKSEGNRIVGYGAGGRANTLLNFTKINDKFLDYIVDDSPERQGKFTPGTHIPIVSPEIFRKDSVRYTILLAWNYKDMIFKKEKAYLNRGGKFVIPLPELNIIQKK